MSVAHIEETLIGVFALTSEGKIIDQVFYPSNPKQIAKAISRQRKGQLTREVQNLVRGLVKRGFSRLTTINAELAESIEKGYDVKVDVLLESPVEQLKDELVKIAIRKGFIKNEASYLELSREVSTLLSRGAITEALSSREAIISQPVQLLGELDTALNGLGSRVKEWFGLHFPEMSRVVRDIQLYARIVAEIGDRANFSAEKLESLNLQTRESLAVLKAAEGSMGAALSNEDINEIQRLARTYLDLVDYREKLSLYTSNLGQEVAPNISILAGPLLAAKLIEKAGGLKRMAMMPSSTIQILGAEKALYRSLKTKAKPPKHGLIFQHPFVNNAPRDQRGIRARHLAAKIAIAARADAFTGNMIADKLKKDLDDVANRI